MRNEMRKILRAGLAGGCATTTDVTVLTRLVHHGAPIALSAFAGAVCGAVVCFVMNKYVTFRDRSPLHVRQVARFGMVASCTAVITALAMQLLAVVLGVPYLLAKAVCAVLVFSCWSYPAQKRVVFRVPDLEPPVPASASLA
jgi:putative flippase GtrA